MARAEQRELPGRQPRARRGASARTCSPSTASRAWSTSSATPRRATACRRWTGSRRSSTARIEGAPSTRCWRACEQTLRECSLPREPFARLIEANRVDQRVTRYETWEQLRGYCALSADPVGELVLGVFGMATPVRVALSNSICTALQLAEHCQDVAEDFAARPRLPARGGPRPLRRPRPRNWLASMPAGRCARCSPSRSREHGRCSPTGAPLIGELHGRARLAVAAFVAGGRAALEAIERAGYDVLAGPPRATRVRRLLVARADAR